jgi:hypothetical protein
MTIMLVATSCAFAASAPVRISGQRAVDAAMPAVPRATHSVSVKLFHFSGSRWRTDDIVEALARAAGLLSTCGVAVTGAVINEVEAPRRFHFYYTPLSRELLRTIRAPKPAVFFVEDTRNDPAFDAEAIGRSNSTTRPELADTIWVAYGSRDLPYAIAHELVHVLSDSGEHSEEPGNLMHDETAPQNSRLSSAQCERLLTVGEANGLLKRMTK